MRLKNNIRQRKKSIQGLRPFKDSLPKNILSKVEIKIVSDSIESLIGAIYYEKGFDFVEKFVLNLWTDLLESSKITLIDAKTKLQEYSLKKFKVLPIYKFISDTGPKHKPNFKVAVKLKDTVFVEAEGLSKKLAQQAAATKLLNLLDK